MNIAEKVQGEKTGTGVSGNYQVRNVYVYAFPKDEIVPENGVVSIERALESYKKDAELKKILMRHWFDRLMGVGDEEILSRYELN